MLQWDDYLFKFNSTGTIAQVYQGGKVVGTIMNMNGQQRVVAMPGTDSAKLQRSCQDYLAFSARSHSNGATTSATGGTTVPSVDSPAPVVATPTMPGAGVAQPVTPQAGAALGIENNGKADVSRIQFDDASKTVTVPRTDGMTVSISGPDVRISGSRGGEYVLRYKKGSAGRLLEQSFDHSHAVGGGIAGGGIEFLYANGGLIYDSGMGGYNVQESRGTLQAKQLSLIAVDAIETVRLVPGHEKFTTPGYKALKEVSQYRLRSDGSR